MDPISAIASLASTVLNKVFGNKSEQDTQKFTLELTKELQQSTLLQKYLDADIKQTEVNIEQAKNENLFVSGPRPYIMWGLGTILILYSLISTFVSLAVALHYDVLPMPPMDPMMRDIILGLLGIGYLTRSYDKRNK